MANDCSCTVYPLKNPILSPVFFLPIVVSSVICKPSRKKVVEIIYHRTIVDPIGIRNDVLFVFLLLLLLLLM